MKKRKTANCHLTTGDKRAETSCFQTRSKAENKKSLGENTRRGEKRGGIKIQGITELTVCSYYWMKRRRSLRIAYGSKENRLRA